MRVLTLRIRHSFVRKASRVNVYAARRASGDEARRLRAHAYKIVCFLGGGRVYTVLCFFVELRGEWCEGGKKYGKKYWVSTLSSQAFLGERVLRHSR